MRIFSLFDSTISEKIAYSYYARGLEKPYLPDVVKEDFSESEYTRENGRLFMGRPVSWNGSNLLNGAVDLRIRLPHRIFADHVTVRQQPGSAMAKAEVLTSSPDGLVCIGSCCPESGSYLTSESFTIPVGTFCEDLTVRLHGAYLDLALTGLDILCADGLEDKLYPLPAHRCDSEGFFDLTDAYVPGTSFEAAYLRQRLGLGETGTGLAISLETAQMPEENFTLCITKDSCCLRAGGRKGLLYASDALASLRTENGLPCCTVEDAPFVPFRGVHIALPERENIPFLKRLIRDVLVPLRYNALIIQITASMRFDSCPEINETWIRLCRSYERGEGPKPAHYGFLPHNILEKSEVQDICDFARGFGLEIIPEIQCFSHSEYLTTTYPDMGEKMDQDEAIDLQVADFKTTAFTRCLCPQHPNYYKVLFRLIDEVVQTMQPQHYLHMGHDEIYDVGICEKCRKVSPAKLYADEVTALNRYIRGKNLRMMIWSDMLHEKYKTAYAIDRIPKDVILLDFTWYFHLDSQENIEDVLTYRGYETMIGNLYSSHFPRYESRIRAKHLTGAEVSTWVACNEESLAYEGKMYDLAFCANMLWNADYDSTMRASYERLLRPIVWGFRKSVGGLPEGDGEATALSGSSRNIPALLRDVCPFETALKAASGGSAEVALQGTHRFLAVTHATDRPAERIMWKPTQVIGGYELQYADGTTWESPIRYACNIMTYDRTYALPVTTKLFRHEGYFGTYLCRPTTGKLADGRDFTLLTHYLCNPFPEKELTGLKLKNNGASDAAILLFDVKTFD